MFHLMELTIRQKLEQRNIVLSTSIFKLCRRNLCEDYKFTTTQCLIKTKSPVANLVYKKKKNKN